MAPVTVITRYVPLVVGWLAAWWMLWRLPVPRPLDPGADVDRTLDDVAVVIPARDEAANLPILLDSLAAARTAGVEVLVVDDHSTDDTAAVATAHGARVVGAPDLPPGWAGKPHACAVGAAATTRPTLVFLDADTALESDGLARIVAEQRTRGGLLSVQPFHLTELPHERLAAIFNVVGVMGVGCATAPPHPRVAGAFGPCIVTSRADYDAVGGHGSVRGEVLEDIALGARYRDAGLPVGALGGRGAITFRMYPAGMRQLVEGFTKNFAGGAGAIPWWRTLLVFLWITGMLVAGWTLPIQSIGWWLGGATPTAVAYGMYLAYALQFAVLARRVGRFGIWTPWAFPLLVVGFLGIFVRSLVHTVRGRTTWRGRTVRTRGA
jgi:hypothetical protein